MAFVVNDAFCVVADVEARAQRGPYTTTSVPTQQQVIDAMAMRAAEVEGVLKRFGLPYTVPSHDRPFPTGAGATDEEDRLRALAIQANCIGAALDAVQMQDGAARAASKDLISSLLELYQAALETLMNYCQFVVESASATSSVNRSVPFTVPTKTPVPQVFGHDTEW